MKALTGIANGLLCAAAMADEVPAGFCYYGELPPLPIAVGPASPGRHPAAVHTHGRKADLVVLAQGRLWYYINESKPGKILFGEPIELKDTEGRSVVACGFSACGGNKLHLYLAAGTAVAAEISGEDVPVLRLRAALASCVPTRPQLQARADFDGDGVEDIVVGGAAATTLHSARGTTPGTSPQHGEPLERAINFPPAGAKREVDPAHGY